MAKIVFLGGGVRESILKNELSKKHTVFAINNSKELQENSDKNTSFEVLIAPLSGTDNEGIIKESEGLSLLKVMDKMPGTYLLIGAAKEIVAQKAKLQEISVIELGQYDELAWLNAIPTAEGTIQALMLELGTTISGAKFLILGAGRIALTLALRLKLLGADVLIAARANAQIAKAKALTLRATELAVVKGSFEAIINTVPAAFLEQEFFLRNQTPLYVELASVSALKGPIDSNIKNLFLPGLPGKYAPKEAGAYLANTVPKLIDELLKGD